MIGPLILLLAGVAFAAGTTPRETASKYAIRASLQGLDLGVEYMVRTIGGDGRTFLVNDYLVVEVALYTAKNPLTVRTSRFALRVNGKKRPILPQTPGMVAASLKYPDWERRPTMEATAGPVIFGRPQPAGRFPGDQRPQQERLPAPPKAPNPDDRSGSEPTPKMSPAEIATEHALPEGELVAPVSGYLYFAHKGKPGSIKTVELIYDGPEGNITLRLK